MCQLRAKEHMSFFVVVSRTGGGGDLPEKYMAITDTSEEQWICISRHYSGMWHQPKCAS
jgi:hypothetical protein